MPVLIHPTPPETSTLPRNPWHSEGKTPEIDVRSGYLDPPGPLLWGADGFRGPS